MIDVIRTRSNQSCTGFEFVDKTNGHEVELLSMQEFRRADTGDRGDVRPLYLGKAGYTEGGSTLPHEVRNFGCFQAHARRKGA